MKNNNKKENNDLLNMMNEFYKGLLDISSDISELKNLSNREKAMSEIPLHNAMKNIKKLLEE